MTHAQQQLQQQQQLLQDQQDQPATPVAAWQHGRLTLGFSGGGFLLPYHLGVYQSLAAMGIVGPSTPMAGSSAGSLVVSGIKAGLSLQQQMDSFLEAAHACRADGVNGRLRKVLKAQLIKAMPADAAERCSDGTCWISVTQVFPRPANKLYGGFSSRQQLIKALLASCHLPRVSDGGLFTSYKSLHKRVFDGGFSNLCPVPPVPLGSSSSSSSSSTTQANHSSTPQLSAAGAGVTTAEASPGLVTSTDSSIAGQHGSNDTSTPAASAAQAISSSEPHPTAPAAALMLQRIDSTKGITTKLLPSKSTTRTSNSVTSSNARGVTRSLSAPGNSSSHAAHESHGLHSSSSSSSSSRGHSATGPAHKGLQLGSLLVARRQQQRQAADAERLLAACCEVTGPGCYVTADGWFAVRVCVLPSQYMHQFPAMFRAPSPEEVSIALDKFQQWPHDLDATTQLALYPQADDFLWDLFSRGQQDGISWAQQQGFPKEVLKRLREGEGVLPAQLRVCRGAWQQQQQGQSAGLQGQRQGQRQQEAVEVTAAAAEGMKAVQQTCSGAGPSMAAS